MTFSLTGAEQALQGLHAKLNAAILEAHAKGMDFVHGPVTANGPDPFEPFDITRPITITVECKAGAVDPGQDWPADFTVYRVPDADADGRHAIGAALNSMGRTCLGGPNPVPMPGRQIPKRPPCP